MKTKKIGRSLVIRLPQPVFDRLGELAADDEGVPRYAEIARALLVSGILPRRPVRLRTAAAVLTNAMFALSGDLVRILGDSRDDLIQAVGTVTAIEPSTLDGALTSHGTGRKVRDQDRARLPILHVPIDSWMRRPLQAVVDRFAASDNAEALLRADPDRIRSPIAYEVIRILRQELDRPDLEEFLDGYTDGLRRIRSVLAMAVERQRAILQHHLVSTR